MKSQDNIKRSKEILHREIMAWKQAGAPQKAKERNTEGRKEGIKEGRKEMT